MRDTGARQSYLRSPARSPGHGPSDEAEAPVKAAEKANFGLSGALAKDKVTGSTFNGIELKWSEPADARAPSTKWRLYVFKGTNICLCSGCVFRE